MAEATIKNKKRRDNAMLKSSYLILGVLTLLGIGLFSISANANTFVVNTTQEPGVAIVLNGVCDDPSTASVVDCTLREAIAEANANLGVPDTITFDIPSTDAGCTAGVCTIPVGTAVPAKCNGAAVCPFLGTALPALTDVVANGTTIDALSQETVEPNNCQLPARPCIVIDGTAAGVGANGFTIAAASPDNTIKGFVIINFDADGIKISSDRNKISNNIIGLAADGVTGGAANSNGADGVNIDPANDNVIGPGNVISNNDGSGVQIDGDRNIVKGNLIGTDATGLVAKGNDVAGGSAGVAVEGGNDNVIGGTTLADRNVISATLNEEGVDVSDSDVNRTQISGNIIGLGIDGSTVLGNNDNGIEINSDGEVCVGGVYVSGVCTPAAGALLPNGSAGNLVSGNFCDGCDDGDGDGIRVEAGNGSHKFFGNFIGTDINGTACKGNEDVGIDITTSSSDNNVIGGTDPHAGNLISCNTGSGVADGIAIVTGSTGNLIAGNIIGLNRFGDATAGFGNQRDGVNLTASSNNCVGGDTAACTSDSAASRNIISRNGRHGVKIDDTNTNTANTIRGNYIGTNKAGDAAAGNGADGVNIDPADGNIIGPNNVISSNVGNGVTIDGDSNVVKGNKIGTDVTGTVDLGNGLNGVLITVGPGADDTVSIILPIPDSALNVIGGTTVADRNIISGNGANGVFLNGPLFLTTAVQGNSVLGNYIGTDVSGTVTIPNDEDGILLHGAILENCIGGLVVLVAPTVPACVPQTGPLPTGLAGNLISGNGRAGFPVVGGDVNGDNGIEFITVSNIDLLNSVISNFIGLDATGLKALGNRDNGIFDGSAIGIECIGSSFILNGCTPVSGVINGRNVISGNGRDGIKFKGTVAGPPFPPIPFPLLDVVISNYIGTNKDGTACTPTPCGNGDDGVDLDPVVLIFIGGNAASNPLVRNVISGNGFPTCVDVTNGCNGVEISGVVGPPGTVTSTNNFVTGNFIGIDKTGLNPLGNKNDGVLIRNGAQDNLVGVRSSGSDRLASCTDPAKNLGFGNVIAFNGSHGVEVNGGQSFSNTIRCNSIHDNGGKGIALTADNLGVGNNNIPPPSVTATSSIDGTANVGSTVDGYNDNNGEGQTVIGQANPNTLFNCNGGGICQFHINGSNPLPNATATQTSNIGDTSEFSNSLTTINCLVTATSSPATLKFGKWGSKWAYITVKNQGTLAATIVGFGGLIAKNLSIKQIKFGKKTLLPPFIDQLPPGTQQTFKIKLTSSLKQTVSAPYVNVVGVCNGFDFNVPAVEGDEIGLISAIATPLKVKELSVKSQAGQITAEATGLGIQSVQLQLFDTMGRLIAQQMADDARLTLSAGDSHLANGVYLAVVTVRGYAGKSVRSEVKRVLIVR